MGAFKRSLFGYSRGQVDTAMAACSEQKATAERELLVLSEMLLAREREVDALRIQLADAHARHDRSLRSLEILAGHLEELHAQARGQATRIRMKALSDAALVTERASEALDAVKRLQDARGVADAVAGSGSTIAAEAESIAAAAAEAVDVATNGSAASVAGGAAGVDQAGDRAGEIAAAWSAAGANGSQATGTEVSAAQASGVYQGDIELEIGPLGDFSQLLGFESAAGDIAGASDISVRRFASGRATLGLRLDEPIELLRELEERAPFEFKVRHTGGSRLVLDIDEQPAE